MKRTGEIVLTAIGLIFSLIGTLIIATTLLFSNTDMVLGIFEEMFLEEGLVVDPGEIESFISLFLGFGWVVFTVLLISTLLGVISVYFFAGNKKPRTASIISIIAAILITVGTVLTGFIPGLLYLIAGIIGLVRKTPSTQDPLVTEANPNLDQSEPKDFN